MAIQDEVRTDLQDEVFSEIGKTVTLKVQGSEVYNTRGELEQVTETTSSITVVPYDIINPEQSHEPFGNFEVGNMAVAIPYTVSVSIDDVLEIEGIEYQIKEISENFLPDNVVTIVRIVEKKA